MGDPDRRTTIDADQIKDYTLTPSEFDSVDSIADPQRWQILMWDKISQKMKWFYTFGNRMMR